MIKINNNWHTFYTLPNPNYAYIYQACDVLSSALNIRVLPIHLIYICDESKCIAVIYKDNVHNQYYGTGLLSFGAKYLNKNIKGVKLC